MVLAGNYRRALSGHQKGHLAVQRKTRQRDYAEGVVEKPGARAANGSRKNAMYRGPICHNAIAPFGYNVFL